MEEQIGMRSTDCRGRWISCLLYTSAEKLKATGVKVAFTDLCRDDMAEAVEDAFRYDRLAVSYTHLATHKDFIKFLADIEIYVDGIATMQIQNLNALVDTVRHEIIERYRPGEDDPHLKVLKAAHISDDEYFSHMVLDDLNLIIRDIRDVYKRQLP